MSAGLHSTIHSAAVTALLLFIVFSGCSSPEPISAPIPDLDGPLARDSADLTGYYPWGFWDFQIARDGSSYEVVPNRSANSEMWGYHMNVVKFLEVSPCDTCLKIGDIELLPNGDVSVDITLRHPFMDRKYTGFDVRGIVMFPASQYYPDDNIRELIGLNPYDNGWKLRIANHDYGDAELVNADGWTVAWSSEEGPGWWDHSWYDRYAPDTEMPIFRYYPGIFSSGENLSTLSAFKRFHSTDVRHMFEVGQSVTETYIIRPPAQGLIKASYAVYAHWFPPTNVPVIDPATDFPPEANSPLPYEFYVTQDAPLDPDNLNEQEVSQHVHWHIKTWSIDNTNWKASSTDLTYSGGVTGGMPIPHESGETDDYYVIGFYLGLYPLIPDAMPGTWPILCNLGVFNPNDQYQNSYIGQDTYIAKFEYSEIDGEW